MRSFTSLPSTSLLLTILVSACSLVVVPRPAVAQDAGEDLKPDNVAPLMRRKLDRAKNILEGLTLEQYDKISRGARELRLLSTEAGWNIVQTEEYRKQSDDFRRACDSIENAAKAKDIHRAALAYVALTVRCVECHSYMREHKIKLTTVAPLPLQRLAADSPRTPDIAD